MRASALGNEAVMAVLLQARADLELERAHGRVHRNSLCWLKFVSFLTCLSLCLDCIDGCLFERSCRYGSIVIESWRSLRPQRQRQSGEHFF